MLHRRLVVFSCFASYVILGIVSAMLGPTLPAIAASVSLSLASAGILRAVRQVGNFGAIVIGGRVIDRRDSRLLLVPGVIMTGLGLLGLINGSLALVLTASLIIGIGTGFMDITPNFNIGVLYGAGAASVLAALHMFYGVGLSVGPLIADWATRQFGSWHGSYLIVAVLTVIVGVLFAGVSVHRASGIVHQRVERDAPRIPVRWTPLLPLIVMIFLYNGAGTGIGDWLYTHMQLVAKADSATASQITALYGLALTCGRLIGIVVLRKFDSRHVLIVALALASLGSVGLVFFGANTGAAAVSVMLIGLGFAPVTPVVVARGGQQQPEARGAVIAALTGIAAVGGITVPVIQGWVGGGVSGGVSVTMIAALIMFGASLWLLATTSKPSTAAA